MISGMWGILDTGAASVDENMRSDAQLLAGLETRQEPLVHFYDWVQDAATYGILLDPAKYFDITACSAHNLSLGRRPTGGGITFHMWDLAFSVLLPASHPAFSQNTLQNYAFVNGAVLRAVQKFCQLRGVALASEEDAGADVRCRNVCMAAPTKYDVVLGGRKIAGAAQRRTKWGLLHQGSIALIAPSAPYLRKVLRTEMHVIDAICTVTYPLLSEERAMQPAKREIQQLIHECLEEGE